MPVNYKGLRKYVRYILEDHSTSSFPPSGFLEGSVIKDVLYHGTSHTPQPGSSLRPDMGGEYGIYLAPRHRYARNYGPNLVKVFVNLKNPLVVNDKSEISSHDLTMEDVQRIREAGHDGIVAGNHEVVAFDSQQVWVIDVD